MSMRGRILTYTCIVIVAMLTAPIVLWSGGSEDLAAISMAFAFFLGLASLMVLFDD